MEIPRRYFLKSTGAFTLYYGIRPFRTLAAVALTKHDSKPEELYKDIVKDYGARVRRAAVDPIEPPAQL